MNQTILLHVLIVVVLFALLYRLHVKNKRMKQNLKDLIDLREAALDISNKQLKHDNMDELLQYILESCMKLIPKSSFGSILMFNQKKMLVARASIGFIKEEITDFELRLEDSFLYIASDGKIDETLIINRLSDIILDENIVKSEGDQWAIRSEVSAPLYIENELIGLLCIDGNRNDLFTEKDIHVLDYMAKQISRVIDKHQLYEEVLFLSKFDVQTKLLNRNTFDTEATKMIDRAVLTQDKLSLVIIDLDDLKRINDTYGHASGDDLIKTFADAFIKCFKKSDLGARYGGDEFVAIINHKDEAIIEKELNDLQAKLKSNPIYVGDTSFYPSFSFGIADMTDQCSCFDDIYKQADQRMYNQKRSKKQTIDKAFKKDSRISM